MRRGILHLGWQDLLLLVLALLSIAMTGVQLAANWKAEDNSRKESVLRQNESDSTEEVEDLLLQAEASQRGYLLTGQPSYLNPYLDAVRDLPDAISKIGQAGRPGSGRHASEAPWGSRARKSE